MLEKNDPSLELISKVISRAYTWKKERISMIKMLPKYFKIENLASWV